VKDGTRAAEIISRIRLLFKKGTPERKLVDVNEVIREDARTPAQRDTRYSISVRAELTVDLPEVMGDRVQLQQVFMNLMLNGIDAMKDVEGTRKLTIKSQRAEKHEHLLVSVSDTGVRVAAAARGPDLQSVLLPRSSTGPVWDYPLAGPSSNRMAAACGLPTTLHVAQVFISLYPPKSRAPE